MNKAILFKALQRKNRYRNPDHILDISDDSSFSLQEMRDSEQYLQALLKAGVHFTFPGDENYPNLFYQMSEPPLFLEYMGQPAWNQWDFLAVVGSRECHDLTAQWVNTHLLQFLKIEAAGVVSGGARGVDLKSHLTSLRAQKPTVAFLPCGLNQIYPHELRHSISEIINGGGAIVSEFELNQKIHKSYFYFRNRLIAAMGRVCLVAQASLKSGTLLTVHHALQNGRPVITIPSHPMLNQFSGNLKLINEGAHIVIDSLSLYDFWKAESWSR